jgi:hypothetical protein
MSYGMTLSITNLSGLLPDGLGRAIFDQANKMQMSVANHSRNTSNWVVGAVFLLGVLIVGLVAFLV